VCKNLSQRTTDIQNVSPIWQTSEFFTSNYFQIGQHVVLSHIQIAQDFETFFIEIWKTARQASNTEIALQEKLIIVIFQKKGEYLLSKANIIFSMFRKTHNTLRIDHCLNVRHSQPDVFFFFFFSFFLSSFSC